MHLSRRGASEAVTATLIILGVLIGAGSIYGTLSVTGRSFVTTSTVYTTSASVVTSVFTSTTTLPLSDVVVMAVAFPSDGTMGQVAIYNTNGVANLIVEETLTYAGQTCQLSVGSPGVSVPPGLATLDWIYASSDPCLGVPMNSGEQFVATITFSNEAQLSFAGVFVPSSLFFESGTSSAQVSAQVTYCTHSGTADVCTVTLTNTGTLNVAATGCTIMLSGTAVTGAVTGGAQISIGAGSSATSICTVTGAAQTVGSEAVGSFALSNGALVPFAGVWS